MIEVADLEQALAHLAGYLSLAAGADVNLAKVRMSDRHVGADIANAAADRAVWVPGQVGIGLAGPVINV